jgi:hypothetical protein
MWVVQVGWCGGRSHRVLAQAVWAEPRNGHEDLANREAARGAFVLVERCGDVDFADKVRRAQEAGAVAAIVVNNEVGPALLCMGPAKPHRDNPWKAEIPALMVTRAAGKALEEVPLASAPPVAFSASRLTSLPLRACVAGGAAWARDAQLARNEALPTT